MEEQAQVLLGTGPRAVFLDQSVERQAEPGGREQVLAVPVVRERARLAHQRVDDVPVMDRVPVPTDQPRERVHEPVRVPHLDTVGEQPGLDRLADQPAVDRVRVAVDVDQAARIDPAPDPQAAVDAPRRQRVQRRQLLVEPVPATGIACGDQALEELEVLGPVDEVAGPAHQQGLIDGALEVPVGRLVVAVLVGRPHVGSLAGQAVVLEQVPVAGVERAPGREVVDGGRQAVGAVPRGHATELPQGVLQPVGEGLERLRGTQGDRLPVRVAQYEVIDQVLERLALDRDRQRVHGGEVAGGQIAGVVDLLELDVLRRSVSRLPLADPALEGAPVRVVERTGVLGLEPVEERLGGQPRLGAQARGDGAPDVGEGIGARAVGARGFGGAGERAAGAVLACGLVVHVRPPGGRGQWRSAAELAEQLADLGIRDHRTPPRRGQGLA